jgi:putative ABC transport system permease protein
MLSDLRLAFRQLIKSPGFTTVAVVTLALGIGLNVSMFSLLNLLVLRPLPYPEKDRLVRIYRTTPQSQTADHTAADYLDLARDTHALGNLAAYRLWGYTLVQTDRPPVTLSALRVSANFFSVLGMQPELGRSFSPDEDRPGNHVMIISHETWKAQFGGDPGIIGRTVQIDGEPTTIVGVLPAAFSSIFLWGPGDAFRPLAFTDAEKRNRTDTGINLIARLGPGLSLPQLNARLATLATRLDRDRPPARSRDGLRAVTLQSTAVNPGTRGFLLLLLGLAAAVLLIACGNLANLLLAKAVARTQEFAVRAALGASRYRLLRPMLCESLLLALGGGLLGIFVAAWSNAWLSHRLSANGYVTFDVAMDWKVFGFALALSAATGLIFGLAPAWAMSRVRVNDTLKSGGRSQMGNRVQHRFRHSLIVGQFALALVLLAGAGASIRGFNRMLARATGWDRHSLLQGIVSLPSARYKTPTQTYGFYQRLEEQLRALPGVENVAIGWTLPVYQFLTSRSYVVEGRPPPPPGREPIAAVNGVTPSFLPTLKIKLLEGRNFAATDTLTSPLVVIINESMARALFPGQNPVGQRLGGVDPANRQWAEIVGVIPDVRFAVSITTPATQFLVLRPLAQEPWGYVTVAVRAPDAAALAAPMRRVVASLDPDLNLQQVGTVNDLITRQTGFDLMDTLLAGFATLGLFLAALGLSGVIARLVVQRTPEIGVRVALGAQTRDVVWLILGAGLRLSLFGAALGLLGAAGLVRLLSRMMPNAIPGQDPVVLATVTLLLLAVALVACWLPARRAARIDPLIALRGE